MSDNALNLRVMTKVQLKALADERGIELKNVSKTAKNEIISIIAQAINAQGGGKKQRIREAVTALFDLQTSDGENLDELNGISQDDFLNQVLAVAPQWKQSADEKQIKRHFAWYKSNYRKNHGGLIRPRKNTADTVSETPAETETPEVADEPVAEAM